MKLKNSLISHAYFKPILRLVIHSNSTPFGVGRIVNSFSFFLRIASGANNPWYLIPSGFVDFDHFHNWKILFDFLSLSSPDCIRGK
jgi:hypothetical protein